MFSPATSVVHENAVKLSCCEAPEMSVKPHPAFHWQGGGVDNDWTLIFEWTLFFFYLCRRINYHWASSTLKSYHAVLNPMIPRLGPSSWNTLYYLKYLYYMACVAFDSALAHQSWDVRDLIPLRAKNVTEHGLFTMWLLSPHLPGTWLVMQSATWEILFEPLSLRPFSACQQGTWPEMLRGRAERRGHQLGLQG